MCVVVVFFFFLAIHLLEILWYHVQKNIVINENLFILCIDYHRCQKALDAKGVDTAPCDWYKRVYKSLCPLSWVNIPSSSIAVSIRIVHKDLYSQHFRVLLRLRNGTPRWKMEHFQERSEDGTFSKALHQGNRNASVCGIVSPQPSRALSMFVHKCSCQAGG